MCSSLFVVAYVQTLLFSSFLFTTFFGRTPEFFSPLFFFFCKLCTIFRSTLFINLLSTHIHCCNGSGGTRTHTKSKAHSPLHWGCQTQLKSCDLVTRFRPDLRCTTHTHGRRSWSSPFCLGFTPIAPPSRPLLGNFSSFAILATTTRTLCHFLRRWSSNLEPPLCSPFTTFFHLLHEGQLGP